MASSNSTSSKISIILSIPSDWDEWLEVIKSKAIAGQIWEYVDPSTETILPAEPLPPTPTSINQNKTIFAELDENEKDE